VKQRGVIVARIAPGAREEVAAIFADSDAGDLPHLAGVSHRSLFALDDLYIHLVELDGDLGERVTSIQAHPLFRDISEKLSAYITPYNPETWRSPKDANAVEFYSWDAEDAR
jgi:cyclase